jgi:hypothetical protein
MNIKEMKATQNLKNVKKRILRGASRYYSNVTAKTLTKLFLKTSTQLGGITVRFVKALKCF